MTAADRKQWDDLIKALKGAGLNIPDECEPGNYQHLVVAVKSNPPLPRRRRQAPAVDARDDEDQDDDSDDGEGLDRLLADDLNEPIDPNGIDADMPRIY